MEASFAVIVLMIIRLVIPAAIIVSLGELAQKARPQLQVR